MLPIAAVERETGLAKDTLRVWERRYGFPRPLRDAAGVRGYPREQVERLCRVRRLLLAGERPGRLFGLPADQFEALLASVPPTPCLDVAAPVPGAMPWVRMPLAEAVAAIRTGGPAALRHWLTGALARLGLSAFVLEGLAPLTAEIGVAWQEGRLAVYEEHLFSEVVESVLRAAMWPFQAGYQSHAPRVLLTTLPGEEHGLGLLMAEAMMTLDAARCVSLGVQTPIDDLPVAAVAQRADIVALSCSESLPAEVALPALERVRARLPAEVALWLGGGAAFLKTLHRPGILVLSRLVDIPEALADWRTVSAKRAP